MSQADWIVLVLTLSGIIAYGIYKSRTTHNLDGYFLDNRSMPWGLILVGALNVGSMATVWHGDVTPRKHREVTALPVTGVLEPPALDKGAEMGRFNMGSTVILLFPAGAVEWQSSLVAGRVLRMGERIGTMHPWMPAAR